MTPTSPSGSPAKRPCPGRLLRDLDNAKLSRRTLANSFAVSGHRAILADGRAIREPACVRTMTAAEASRTFAALPDEVEHGQTVIVTREGRRIATIGPAINENGAEVLALMKSSQLDNEFAADVRAARGFVDSETAEWPGTDPRY